MPKSIAEMKSRPAPSRPTDSLTVCTNLDVLAQVSRLEQEKRDLPFVAPDVDGEKQGPPSRAMKRPDPREAEIDAELERLLTIMREDENEIGLRGIESGEWQRWMDANPPRDENVIDAQYGYGFVNVTALAEDMGTFLHLWNGEEMSPADWEWLRPMLAPGDVLDMVQRVIRLHMTPGVKAPKLRKPSSTTPKSEPASD